jgi:alcohol dehydrogenase (cytochrome c)
MRSAHVRRYWFLAGLLGACPALSQTQPARVEPVDTASLERPDPSDWLSFSRTPDAQRYSPLDQIDTGNVERLTLAWSRGLGSGTLESIPIVRDGVMYMLTPRAVVQAVDATNGDLLWEFRPLEDAEAGSTERSKTIAIYDDVVLLSGPESLMYGIDARTGELRWQAPADARVHTSGPIVADGKVIAGGAGGSGVRGDG